MKPEDQSGAAQARLRVGVLGNGYWAWWCHGTALQAHPDVDFIGFWGRNADRTDQAVGRVGGQAFERVEDLLESVDAVSIALPPQAQAAVAVQAARAGKHLLLDKPLALDLDAAQEIVGEVRTAGVRTVSFMTLRFQPEVAAWLARMRAIAREHGPWESLTVSMAGNINVPGSPYATSEWRHEYGGLWDAGPHALTLVRDLLAPVKQVFANRGVRDVVNVSLEHADGASSLLTLTLTAPPDAQHSTAVLWGPGGRHEIELPRENYREAYGRALAELLAVIESGQEHPLSASYGRDTVAILDAARLNLSRPAADRMDAPTGLDS